MGIGGGSGLRARIKLGSSRELRCVGWRGHGKIILGQERVVTWSNTEGSQSVRNRLGQPGGAAGKVSWKRTTEPLLQEALPAQLLSLPLAHPDLLGLRVSMFSLPSSDHVSSRAEAWE